MSEGITLEELSAIREEQTVYMPSRGRIERKQAIGGGNFSWGKVQDVERCRITAGAGNFRIVADRYAGINPVTITFPYDTDVKAGDRFIDEGSRIYEVRETRSKRSYLTAIQCLTDFMDN